MKQILTTALAALMFSSVAFAQDHAQNQEKEQGFKFTTIKEYPITAIQNQASTGTCWCFSALSFFESEILRKGYKGDLNLSEMYIVSRAYADKAEKFIRVDGNLNFEQGSSFGDVLTVLKEYGAVPESVMPGLNYGETRHMHSEMTAGMKGYVNAIVKNPNRRLSTAWKGGLQGILDAYLGEIPQEFEVNGAKYTPKSYMESLGLNLDDYVALTSFTHHPFYTQFPLEVADNWRWELYYNVPIDELMAIMYNAIETGYTFAWASDVSEKGFTRNGLGTVPDTEALIPTGSDEARWIGLSPQQKEQEMAKKMASPVKEKEITQEMRQKEFDNKQTTDDHGMHIFGLAQDQNGTKYFIVKNSWGEAGAYKGIWYVSDAFVRYKTIDILVHKDAIPKDIKKKLGIK